MAERLTGRKFALWISLAVVVIFAPPSHAQSLDPVVYTITFSAPHTHYVEVEAAIPASGNGPLDLMMPVWTPGSYLVREYARHVEGLQATDPTRQPLHVEKTRKNRWRVAAGKADMVWLRYRVYAHEMSARTNWVDDEFALLNGAATFITIVESPSRRAHHVRISLPPGWTRTFSGMTAGETENTYVAADYDMLVDSPLVAGNPSVHEFQVLNTPHYIVSVGKREGWNSTRAVQDLAKTAASIARFWGGTPFDRYYFFNIFADAGGAIEHRNSTVMVFSSESSGNRPEYVDWLSTAAHEYFHAWNVKRLRPVELGPFDYEAEVYTRALWFVEGVTDYYAQLHLARAGVITPDEYLEMLSGQIRSLQTTPGRRVQSAESASFDAWIKYYRPDENTPNSSVSYYVKGAVIGFLLDAKLRRIGGDSASLDVVMAKMYERFSGPKGFSYVELREQIEEAAGAGRARETRQFLTAMLETTDELNYTEALDWFGLRMAPGGDAPHSWLGVATVRADENAVVRQVIRGSPAALAGISIGDRLTAINGSPLADGQLAERLGQLPVGSAIAISAVRRGETRVFHVVLGADPGHGWWLSISPTRSSEQKRHFENWLR